MKKIQQIVTLVCLALAVAGCRNNNVPTSEPKEYDFAVEAAAVVTGEEEFEAATRATLEEGTYNYYWANGDMIGLFATNDAFSLKLTNVKMVNNNHATEQRFTSFDGKLSQEQYDAMPEGTYYYAAYYPYQQTATLDATNFTLSGLTLPSVQSVSAVGADGFRSDYDFMLTTPVSAGTVAAVAPADIQFHDEKGFKHLFSAVRMSVTADEMGGQKISSLTLTAPEDVALTGDFEVNLMTRAVTFTNPSNSVTVNIPSGMGDLMSGNNCVWAIINPVDLSSTPLVLTVTTESGYQYTYTFDGANYIAGSFHNLSFKIPQMKVTANRIYTSYNDRNNSLDGSSIFFDGVQVSGALPDANGYGYSVEIAETGVMCNGTPIYTTTDKATSFSYTHKVANYTQWGEYNAQGYVKLANGSVIISAAPNVHVTGIPLNKGVNSSSYGDNNEENGWCFGEDNDRQGSVYSTSFPWYRNGSFTDRGGYMETPVRGEAWVVSMPFHIPSGSLNVLVRGYVGASAAGNLQAGATSSSNTFGSTVSTRITNIDPSKGAYCQFPQITLTTTNNRVFILDDEDGWFGSMFYIHKVAVSYY